MQSVRQNREFWSPGSSGLLGRSLLRILQDDYEITGMDRKAGKSPKELVVDLSQRTLTVESIVRVAPTVVVHTAAQTNVDLCEKNRELAQRVNVDGTANVVEGCLRIGAKLIFVSTDYVFDGEKGNYKETDQPNPIDFYGVTKLEAERIVAKLPTRLIVRTSVLYGWHPSKLNFATWIMQGLSEHQNLRIVRDHINSPTFSDNLAMAIRAAIDRKVTGVLHIAGSERISRFEFARRFALKFNFDEALLVPVEMRDLGWVAKRPKDSSLDVGKAEKELGIELFGVERGLDEMLRSRP